MNPPTMSHRFFATLAVLALSSVATPPAYAQPAERPVLSCAPAALFVAIASSVVSPSASAQDLRNLSATAVEKVQNGESFEVKVRGTRSVSSVPFKSASAPRGTSGSCSAIAPNWTRVADATSVRGIEVAALAAVLRYRQSHRWPLTPVDPNDPANAIAVYTLGNYAYVSIRGNLPPRTFACAPEESYRIDPATFDVLPYQNDCIEANQTPRLLPRLRHLPKTAPGR